ncbi:MAG: glucose 1-dehydrogenase [Chloroflexota bacterium]
MYAVGLAQNTKGPVLRELPKPFIETEDQVLVKVLQVGIDGTDRNMIRYDEKDLPPGEDFITLGHEALGRVEAVGSKVKTLRPGDMVTPTVRRGCNECAPCLNGQSDMCYTGRYKERGIHKLHGFFTEYFVEREEYLVKVPPDLGPLAILAEPLSISEKALSQLRSLQLRVPWLCEHAEHNYGSEAWGHCKQALVIGAGPLGLLGIALLRLAQVDTWVVEVASPEHKKVQLLKELGAHHVDAREKTPLVITEEVGSPDFILEASGASDVAFNLLPTLARNGVYILTGIPRGISQVCLDGNLTLRQLVRYNQLIVGIINSNREHYVAALHDLASLKQTFGPIMDSFISHRFRLLDYEEAFNFESKDQVKVIFDLTL